MDTFTPWTIVVDLGIISALMLLGKLIRVKVKGIQKFLIPPAVLAGIMALVLGPEVLGWLAAVPTQLYQALPFIITAIVLVASSIRNKQGSGLPASLGVNYFREER